MEWIKEIPGASIPVKSWCKDVDELAMKQVANLAAHPVLFKHVALMPDCHAGLGIPIGGVIAARDAVIPSAVGVDIGCGMIATETDIPAERFADMQFRRSFQEALKKRIPVGEGVSHKTQQPWEGFERYLDTNGSVCDFPNNLDRKNLGTLGGGNHFIELQVSESGFIWMMIHSGSRNLGQRIERFYQQKAMNLNEMFHSRLPNPHLAFLPMGTEEGQAYFRDMNFALEYAQENRSRMMTVFRETLSEFAPEARFVREVNIHHNYAALETHFGQSVYVHRKGATSARDGEIGIIPGSMGSSSYIVRGLGNAESFTSCSHGAGRRLSRTKACMELKAEDCDAALEGIVYERWKKFKGGFGHKQKHPGLLDLSEAPQAYKEIEEVIAAEADLVEPLVRLRPIAVLKG